MNLWRATTQRSRGAVVGIDAGNVDVRVVIATVDALSTDVSDARVPVLGVGVSPAQGLSRGAVTDARRLGAAIRTAMAQAEKAAGHRVLGAYFSVPLAQFRALGDNPRAGRVFLASPIAVRELTLRAAEQAPIWQDVAHYAGLAVVGIVPSVLAASAAVVLPEEHEHGVIVIECGAEHTSVAVFVGGTVTSIGTVPVGGDHITRDLATVLGIDPMEAERLKFEVRSARSGSPGVEVLVRGADGTRSAVSVALIAAIITARVDQMLAHVCEMVKPARSAALARTRDGASVSGVGQVVLCGGGAALSGLAPMARAALGMPVRIAGAWGFAGPIAVQSPVYAPVLGLLRWRAAVQPHDEGRDAAVRFSTRDARPGAKIGGELPDQPIRIGQTRWQAWLREFLP